MKLSRELILSACLFALSVGGWIAILTVGIPTDPPPSPPPPPKFEFNKPLSDEARRFLGERRSIFMAEFDKDRKKWRDKEWDQLFQLYKKYEQHGSAAIVCTEAMRYLPSMRYWHGERAE